MDYDLCDSLNRKLLKIHGLYEGNWTEKSNCKHPQNFLNEVSNIWDEDEYLNFMMLVGEQPSYNVYGHWIYRDGKLSGLVTDHEDISKRLLTDGMEHRGKVSATSEFLNFSGTIRLLMASGYGMMLQCFAKPSLEQLMAIKDIEREIQKNSGFVAWKVADRRNKNIIYYGSNLEDLHKLPWSKIK
jgi:hypothetical protein